MKGIHTIGEMSYYDNDISLVESFIFHKHNPENLINTISVFNYYYSQLLNYWTKLKDNLINKEEMEKYNIEFYQRPTFRSKYLNKRNIIRSKKYGMTIEQLSDAVNNDNNRYIDNLEGRYQKLFPIDGNYIVNFIDSENLMYSVDDINGKKFSENHIYPTTEWLSTIDTVLHGYEYKFITNNIDLYEERFLDLLKNLKDYFEQTNVIDLFEIIFLFYFVVSLMCNQPFNETIHSNRSYSCENIYILPNNNGFISLNTYLYAFFEGINLVGIPSQISTFDSIRVCPVMFMVHDLNHCHYITNEIKNVDKLRNIYYKILNSGYSRKLKELLILVLWVQIHEELHNFYFDDQFNESLEDFYFDTILNSTLQYIEALHDEFKSFSDFILSSDGLNLISEYFPSFDSITYEPLKYYHMLVMLYGYAFTKEYIFLNNYL